MFFFCPWYSGKMLRFARSFLLSLACFSVSLGFAACGNNAKPVELAFEGYDFQSGSSSVYLLNRDDGTITNVSKEMFNDGRPTWAPDGSKIAFQSDRLQDTGWHIFISDPTGANVKLLDVGRGEMQFSPDWSPDGSKIAFSSKGLLSPSERGHIYSVNIDGSELIRLSNGRGDFLSPDWSPDGGKIVFERLYKKDSYLGEPENQFVSVMNSDGSELKDLIDTCGPGGPRWSPTGKEIAFTGWCGESVQIFLMNMDGTDVRQLTFDNCNGYPSWSLDGNQIYFSSTDCQNLKTANNNSVADLFVINSDGSEIQSLGIAGYHAQERP